MALVMDGPPGATMCSDLEVQCLGGKTKACLEYLRRCKSH